MSHPGLAEAESEVPTNNPMMLAKPPTRTLALQDFLTIVVTSSSSHAKNANT
jgi:hypothetical protein